MTDLFVKLQNSLHDLKEDRGAAMAEYGLLLALVAVAAITILVAFGGELVSVFTEANDALSNRGTGATTTATP